jgi:hypothetical protein
MKNLTIELKGIHWNEVVPATGIGRTIDFDFSVTNNLKLNQYNPGISNSAVFITPPSGWSPDNTIMASNTTESFINVPSTNGLYPYGFQVYSPTYMLWASDWRELVNGNMEILNVDYTINQTISANINTSLYNGLLDNSTAIQLLFRPLYTTEFKWDLKNKVLVDRIQDAEIKVDETWWSAAVPTSTAVQIWFGYVNAWNNEAHPILDFIYDPAPTGVKATIPEWHVLAQYSLWTVASLMATATSWEFEAKVTQSWWTYNPGDPMYISSHISYTLDGHYIKYNADVLWKASYFAWVNLLNSSQVWVKVLWKIQSKNQQDLVVGQTGTDIFKLWNNSKSELKESLRKEVTLETKNVSWLDGSITDLSWWTWSAWNTWWIPLRNNTILYYEPTAGTNVVIWDGSIKNIDGIKTIVIKWWNAYITSDLVYSNKSNDMLWIIVIKDDAGNWWNLYVDTEVTQLSWIFYADKAMISYDGINEIDGSTPTNLLKNQLYIYWTLFSENTLWGGIIPKCPYYIWTCTTNLAKKYDLNYLRRYFVYDEDWDWEEDEPYAWGTWATVFSYSDVSPDDGIDDGNFKYPVVIEYNGNIQRIPPPLFENNDF